jgi:hypothetical protein
MPDEQDRLEQIGDQLRAKISSKFTACSCLAGIAVTVLSIQISLLWQSASLPCLLPFSIGGLAAAMLLFIVALLAFDALTMPKLFWSVGDRGHRVGPGHLGYLAPPDLDQLHAQMVYYWVWYAEFATCLLGLAVLTLLVPSAATVELGKTRSASLCGAVTGLVVAAIYVGAVKARARSRFPGLIRPVD